MLRYVSDMVKYSLTKRRLRATRSRSALRESEPSVESRPRRKNANNVAINPQSKAPSKAIKKKPTTASTDVAATASSTTTAKAPGDAPPKISHGPSQATQDAQDPQQRLANIEADFMREQEKNASLRKDRRGIWKAINELESRIATEQKAIFRLIHNNSERDKIDVVEALEARLSDLHDKKLLAWRRD
ncbi:uncharacterized protein FTOL_05469 [Fusarium torulosum]|uniref:Uncharacterized protein n=1 Tax=Fusarium torulosum TaxID=33205 RepID=A0AAE8M7M9_9HYPO|nr:uncharacterized protein FTOL_05469 [Fusarium torulosum]